MTQGQVAAQYVDAANNVHASIYNLNTGLFTDLPDIPASLGTDTDIQAINGKRRLCRQLH